MTGACTYPIYHQRVVNVENGALLHHLVYGKCITKSTDTIISAGDALMLVITHLYQKARRVTHWFARFFFTQVKNDNAQIL